MRKATLIKYKTPVYNQQQKCTYPSSHSSSASSSMPHARWCYPSTFSTRPSDRRRTTPLCRQSAFVTISTTAPRPTHLWATCEIITIAAQHIQNPSLFLETGHDLFHSNRRLWFLPPEGFGNTIKCTSMSTTPSMTISYLK